MNNCNVCPLLYDPSSYNPDTLDLEQDNEAKEYWIECFKKLVQKLAMQAVRSQVNDPTAENRANNFKKDFLFKMDLLNNSNNISKNLTIRSLLDLNESCLKNHGFNDPWSQQKEVENEASIGRLKQRLEELDKLELKEKWCELIKGLLAGNLFDWGAQAVSEILENDKAFGLHNALNCIQKRPWLIDGFEEWFHRLQQSPHTCAIIFVDNSGVDIILGIIPFARELLLRETKVILCANNEPALNDITYSELINVIEKCCFECNILKAAWENNTLLVYGNGQSGPCLDMRNLTSELCTAIRTNNVDLLIIEGMGRALHTNFYAKFKCETLKLAVIKNNWLANRFGGDTFSVICKYEKI